MLDLAEECLRADPAAFESAVVREFDFLPSNPPPVLGKLASLPFRAFLTINFDRLIEFSLSRSNKTKTSQVYPNLWAADLTRVGVFHLHGVVHDGKADNIVLAKGDFEKAYSSDSNLRSFLVQTLGRFPCVFVGTSLSDPYIGATLDLIEEQRRERILLGICYPEIPTHFVIAPKGEVGRFESLEGIVAIPYDPIDDAHTGLDGFLNELYPDFIPAPNEPFGKAEDL